MLKLICSFLLASTLLASSQLQAASQDLAAESRDSTALVIYNEDLALLNEVFTIRLPAGESTLNFQSVSPLINASSAVLHPLPETLVVLNQYFRQALTPEDMLKKSVGQMVSLVSTHPVTGEQKRERARLISVNGGVILEIDGQFETSLAGRKIVYGSLPPGVLSPTLSIGVNSTVDSQPALSLSYLSGGFSWQADYIAQLNEAGDRLQLQAMASINNHSGMDYRAADIELIAGSINRVSSNINIRSKVASTAMMDSAPLVQPVPLADIYVYSLPRPVDLANNSTRQVKLFAAHDIPVEQRYRLSGQPSVYYSPDVPEQTLEVDSYIEFMNVADSHLGKPMPAGVVRVYTQNGIQADALRFIGEDRMNHVPSGARARLKMGKAFDLRGTRKQLSYRRLPVEAPFRQHNEAQIQIVLHNAKNKPVVVQVEETFSGEWVLVDGQKPVVSDARSARWDVLVPARGRTTLDLTVRVKR